MSETVYIVAGPNGPAQIHRNAQTVRPAIKELLEDGYSETEVRVYKATQIKYTAVKQTVVSAINIIDT